MKVIFIHIHHQMVLRAINEIIIMKILYMYNNRIGGYNAIYTNNNLQ